MAKDPSGLETDTQQTERTRSNWAVLTQWWGEGSRAPCPWPQRHSQLLGVPQSSPGLGPGKDKQGPPQAGQKCRGQELLRPPGVSWTHSTWARRSQSCQHSPGLEGFGNCPPGPLHCPPVCLHIWMLESLSPCLHTWLLDPLLFSDSRTEFITAPPHQSKPSEKGSDSTHHLHHLIFSSWPL